MWTGLGEVDPDVVRFLRARIYEDYRRESAGHGPNSGAEMAARIKANIRMGSIGFAITASGGTDGHVKQLAAQYSDHPDYRQEWRPVPNPAGELMDAVAPFTGWFNRLLFRFERL